MDQIGRVSGHMLFSLLNQLLMLLLNITSPSVVKRFGGARDDCDEFEFEARMGHRIDPTPLTERPTGGFSIFVDDYTQGHKKYMVRGLHTYSLVEEVREYIQAKHGIPGQSISLVYSGKALSDGKQRIEISVSFLTLG